MKKGDVFIIAALSLLCLLLFIPTFFSSDKKIAVIYFNGEVKEEIDLSAVSDDYIVEIGGCKLKIERGAATFVDSDCPDKLCVKRGALAHGGDTMACVPNKVVVSIRDGSKNDFDAVAF